VADSEKQKEHKSLQWQENVVINENKDYDVPLRSFSKVN
jgi:hypothetical protein